MALKPPKERKRRIKKTSPEFFFSSYDCHQEQPCQISFFNSQKQSCKILKSYAMLRFSLEPARSTCSSFAVVVVARCTWYRVTREIAQTFRAPIFSEAKEGAHTTIMVAMDKKISSRSFHRRVARSLVCPLTAVYPRPLSKKAQRRN